jgi:hypothetical protein
VLIFYNKPAKNKVKLISFDKTKRYKDYLDFDTMYWDIAFCDIVFCGNFILSRRLTV